MGEGDRSGDCEDSGADWPGHLLSGSKSISVTLGKLMFFTSGRESNSTSGHVRRAGIGE